MLIDELLTHLTKALGDDDSFYDPFAELDFHELDPVLRGPAPETSATAPIESFAGREPAGFKPETFDKMTVTPSERRIAESIFEGSTVGSPGSFQAAQAATMPSVKHGKQLRWFQQSNGQIPTERMVQIAPGHYLKPNAARAFKAMRRAAKKDGIALTMTDSYRDLATQRSLAQSKGLYSQGGLAAEPGTSNHGWGLAVDVGEGEQRNWLANNAKRFGFETIAREPWHWEYEGGYSPDVPRKPLRKARRRPKGRKQEESETLPEELVQIVSPIAGLQMAVGNILGGLEPAPTKRPRSPRSPQSPAAPRGAKGVKAQLYAGFMEAGRQDLAKMVTTAAFDTWIGQESGWNKSATSPANNQGLANDGLFQVWRGHDYNSKGEVSKMSAFEQAVLIARYFPHLTPEKIRGYAAAIRNGSYKGWG